LSGAVIDEGLPGLDAETLEEIAVDPEGFVATNGLEFETLVERASSGWIANWVAASLTPSGAVPDSLLEILSSIPAEDLAPALQQLDSRTSANVIAALPLANVFATLNALSGNTAIRDLPQFGALPSVAQQALEPLLQAVETATPFAAAFEQMQSPQDRATFLNETFGADAQGSFTKAFLLSLLPAEEAAEAAALMAGDEVTIIASLQPFLDPGSHNSELYIIDFITELGLKRSSEEAFQGGGAGQEPAGTNNGAEGTGAGDPTGGTGGAGDTNNAGGAGEGPPNGPGGLDVSETLIDDISEEQLQVLSLIGMIEAGVRQQDITAEVERNGATFSRGVSGLISDVISGLDFQNTQTPQEVQNQVLGIQSLIKAGIDSFGGNALTGADKPNNAFLVQTIDALVNNNTIGLEHTLEFIGLVNGLVRPNGLGNNQPLGTLIPPGQNDVRAVVAELSDPAANRSQIDLAGQVDAAEVLAFVPLGSDPFYEGGDQAYFAILAQVLFNNQLSQIPNTIPNAPGTATAVVDFLMTTPLLQDVTGDPFNRFLTGINGMMGGSELVNALPWGVEGDAAVETWGLILTQSNTINLRPGLNQALTDIYNALGLSPDIGLTMSDRLITAGNRGSLTDAQTPIDPAATANLFFAGNDRNSQSIFASPEMARKIGIRFAVQLLNHRAVMRPRGQMLAQEFFGKYNAVMEGIQTLPIELQNTFTEAFFTTVARNGVVDESEAFGAGVAESLFKYFKFSNGNAVKIEDEDRSILERIIESWANPRSNPAKKPNFELAAFDRIFSLATEGTNLSFSGGPAGAYKIMVVMAQKSSRNGSPHTAFEAALLNKGTLQYASGPNDPSTNLVANLLRGILRGKSRARIDKVLAYSQNNIAGFNRAATEAYLKFLATGS
ncbi:MAG: hypothetical protein AB8B71_13485, partial [Paracoccaceae bacterium]